MTTHEPTAQFVATINTPGYLPVDDDPPVFDTPQQAWAWLAEQRQQTEDDASALLDHPADAPYSRVFQDLARLAATVPDAAWDGTGYVRGDTPGCLPDHDIGLVYTVTALDTAVEGPVSECGARGHDHSGHDVNGRPIPGDDQCGHCHRPVHWDEQIDDYQHDDLHAPDCFLTRRRPGATPCHPERTTSDER